VFADWLIGPGQKVGGYKAGDKVLVKQEKKNKLSSFFNSEQFRVLQKVLHNYVNYVRSKYKYACVLGGCSSCNGDLVCFQYIFIFILIGGILLLFKTSSLRIPLLQIA
jgi:hypothetical protein